MKILFFTDTHIRGSSPKSRKDNFFKTVLNKFIEVLTIAEDRNIDYIIHGGDLFDRPDISITVVSEFANLLKKCSCPFYIVSGNHDIYGYDTKTLSRTMLGFLNNIGLLEIINKKTIFFKKDSVKVQLTSAPYTYNIDKEEHLNIYRVLKRAPDVKYCIHVCHGFLIDKPIIHTIQHTLINSISDTLADITLSGHYHFGFKSQKINGKYFINPGALARVSNSLNEFNRMPKVTIIHLGDSIECEDVYLKSAKPAEEVLDRREMEQHQFKKTKLNEFKNMINSSTNLKDINISHLVREISEHENIPSKIVEETLKRIIEARCINGDMK